MNPHGPSARPNGRLRSTRAAITGQHLRQLGVRLFVGRQGVQGRAPDLVQRLIVPRQARLLPDPREPFMVTRAMRRPSVVRVEPLEILAAQLGRPTHLH